MGNIYGYVRVSSIDQNEDRQLVVMDENIYTFLFCSKNEFNSLCYELVTKIKEKHPHIKRIYVRTEYANISNYLTL